MKANTFSYPVFLSLEDKAALIVGVGKVGQRKLQRLRKSGIAEILALDSQPFAELPPSVQKLLLENGARYENRLWNENDIAQNFIIFACTGDYAENARISAVCARLGKLCNSVTEPENGSFIVPASVELYPLAAALSSNGASPMLVARLISKFAHILADYQQFAQFMGELRGKLVEGTAKSAENRALFEKLCDSPLPRLLLSGDLKGCRCWIKENLTANQAKFVLNALSGRMK